MSNPRDKAVCKHGNEVSILPSFNYVRCVKCDEEAMIYPDTPRPPMSETVKTPSDDDLWLKEWRDHLGNHSGRVPTPERKFLQIIDQRDATIADLEAKLAAAERAYHVPYELGTKWRASAEKAERDLAQSREWRPIESGFPPPHTNVWCLNRNGIQFEGRVCYGMHKPFFTYPRGDGSPSNTAPSWIDVTHWRPLPPPPTTGSAP